MSCARHKITERPLQLPALLLKPTIGVIFIS